MKCLNFMIAVSVALLALLLPAWNIPGHMLSGAIAYQILKRESPMSISKVRAILDENPWYETRWKAQLDKNTGIDHDEMLFMLAARWADDIRIRDRAESHPLWHYVDFPFKPEGEPTSIETNPPPAKNIVAAISENERIALNGSTPEKRAIALTWLFHLIGDVHQPLHAIQLFTREYPNGDHGGGYFCVRVAQDRAPLSLHRLWDGLITSSNNTRTLRNIAIELPSRFTRSGLSELSVTGPEAWAKRELRDRNEDWLPERRIAWNAKRPAERMPRSNRCGCAADGLRPTRQKGYGQADGSCRLAAGNISGANVRQLITAQSLAGRANQI